MTSHSGRPSETGSPHTCPVKITNTADARSNYHIEIAADRPDGSRITTGTAYAFDLEPGQTTEQRLTAHDGWVPATAGRVPLPGTRWDRTSKIIMVGVAVILLVIVAGAVTGSSDDNGGGLSNDPAVAKYEQTWRKPYSATTCGEWHSDMSARQRFAAAADMLAGARNKGDGGTGLPPDSLIRSFEGDISEACVFMEMAIDEIGAGLYVTGRTQYGP
jgi:hypothetical protein